MYGISPIVSKVANILVLELQKEFKESDKLDKINIDLSKYSLPDFNIDKLVIIDSEFNAYDHLNSGLNLKSGEYQVILKLNLKNLYLDSIIHELKHVYVDWKIHTNGGTPIKKSKEVRSFYTKDLEEILINKRNEFKSIIKIIELYYYSSHLEVPSYLENYYFDKNFIDYRGIVMDMLNLKNIEFNNSEINYEFNAFKRYDIPFFKKFKSYKEFLNKSIQILERRGIKILKKLNRLDYQMLKSVKNY